MQATEPLAYALTLSRKLIEMLVADLSDADLLARPVPGANHVAWQLGHLITTEARMQAFVPGAGPHPLPEAFVAAHGKEQAALDHGFGVKEEYLRLFAEVRERTLALVAAADAATLATPTKPPLERLAPTVGAMFAFLPQHTMMHAGQFSVTWRLLGKPNVI